MADRWNDSRNVPAQNKLWSTNIQFGPKKVATPTWFLPIARPHELPIAPYPLFRSRNLFYTGTPSYLNMLANDTDNPFHYLAKRDGSRFIG